MRKGPILFSQWRASHVRVLWKTQERQGKIRLRYVLHSSLYQVWRSCNTNLSWASGLCLAVCLALLYREEHTARVMRNRHVTYNASRRIKKRFGLKCGVWVDHPLAIPCCAIPSFYLFCLRLKSVRGREKTSLSPDESPASCAVLLHVTPKQKCERGERRNKECTYMFNLN